MLNDYFIISIDAFPSDEPCLTVTISPAPNLIGSVYALYFIGQYSENLIVPFIRIYTFSATDDSLYAVIYTISSDCAAYSVKLVVETDLAPGIAIAEILLFTSVKLLFNEINKGGSYEKRLETHGFSMGNFIEKNESCTGATERKTI